MNDGLQVVGISNEPLSVIEDFIEDQGITFPVLHDQASVYQHYNIPGSSSPYPRDFVLDAENTVRLAKTEYEPGVIISVVEDLLELTTEIREPNPLVSPERPVLIRSFPNPFNPANQLELTLRESNIVSVRVYDITGRLVDELVSGVTLRAGTHYLAWQPSNPSSGVYLIHVEAGQHSISKRVLLTE